MCQIIETDIGTIKYYIINIIQSLEIVAVQHEIDQ